MKISSILSIISLHKLEEDPRATPSPERFSASVGALLMNAERVFASPAILIVSLNVPEALAVVL